MHNRPHASVTITCAIVGLCNNNGSYVFVHFMRSCNLFTWPGRWLQRQYTTPSHAVKNNLTSTKNVLSIFIIDECLEKRMVLFLLELGTRLNVILGSFVLPVIKLCTSVQNSKSNRARFTKYTLNDCKI